MGTEGESLALWHGLTLPLLLSVLGIALGVAGFGLLRRRGAPQRVLPEQLDAQWRYRRFMHGLDRVAIEVTAATQRGSLPGVPGGRPRRAGYARRVGLAARARGRRWRLWDSPVQALVALLTVAVAVAATRVRQRLTAVLLVGVTGYAMVVLFVLQGAPDLALTQALVETCTLVVFVLVLRKLPKQIQQTGRRSQQLGAALLGGADRGRSWRWSALSPLGARRAAPVSDRSRGRRRLRRRAATSST